MDDDAKEVLETGLTVVLRPLTEYAENLLGILGGEYLSASRASIRAELAAKTKKILESRNVRPDEVSPSVLKPLLSAAQDESRQELIDLYAKLAAAAADPERRNGMRREFIEIVQQLEPIDVTVLQLVESAGGTSFQPDRVTAFSQKLGVPSENVVTAMSALLRLELTYDKPEIFSRQGFPVCLPRDANSWRLSGADYLTDRASAGPQMGGG